MASRSEVVSIAMPSKTHGVKRTATDALESDQRLAKRFDLLNIDSNGKLYIPIAASSQQSTLEPHAAPGAPAPLKSADDEWMQLEDTKDKVYIYDLDKELAELESDEENPIFLSDIEKHLTRIPKHVLVGQDLQRTEDNQLVLYKVPSSLSVPEEKDSVRKAIIESRARARENQATKPTQQLNGASPAMGDTDEMITTDGEVIMDDVEPMEMD